MPLLLRSWKQYESNLVPDGSLFQTETTELLIEHKARFLGRDSQ